MSDTTLIEQPSPVAKPPPLRPGDQQIIDSVYTRFGVFDKSPAEKSAALQKVIHSRKFFAFGGQENLEMELRVNERIFLRHHAKSV
jgi:hypothetical protein